MKNKILLNIILIITIVFCLTGCNSTNLKKNINDYKWQDMAISIDGNLISYNSSLEDFINMGFTNNQIDLNEQVYSKNTETIHLSKGDYYSGYCNFKNTTNETQNLGKSKILDFQLSEYNYTNMEVILPNGIVMVEDTMIDTIIEKWGKESSKSDIKASKVFSYEWESKNGKIKFYVSYDGIIESIIYEFYYED